MDYYYDNNDCYSIYFYNVGDTNLLFGGVFWMLTLVSIGLDEVL